MVRRKRGLPTTSSDDITPTGDIIMTDFETTVSEEPEFIEELNPEEVNVIDIEQEATIEESLPAIQSVKLSESEPTSKDPDNINDPERRVGFTFRKQIDWVPTTIDFTYIDSKTESKPILWKWDFGYDKNENNTLEYDNENIPDGIKYTYYEVGKYQISLEITYDDDYVGKKTVEIEMEENPYPNTDFRRVAVALYLYLEEIESVGNQHGSNPTRYANAMRSVAMKRHKAARRVNGKIVWKDNQ
jgi:hypothetical protein